MKGGMHQHQGLRQELLSNPFLELLEPEEDEQPIETPQDQKVEKDEKGDDEPDWENILLDDGAESMKAPRDLSDAQEYVEPVATVSPDLSDHLKDQVQMLDLTPR